MIRFASIAGSLLLLGLAACASAGDGSVRSEDENLTSGRGIGETCGGIVGFTCAPALHCELDHDFADALGTCQPGADVGATCGGIAGFVCRDGLECAGQAAHPDASGTCQPKAGAITCLAFPSCDQGDESVETQAECGDACYTRTMCGSTVLCKGEAISVEGTLAQVVAVGGETTGFAVQSDDAQHELVLDPHERASFVDGAKARVTGRKTTLFGVESGARPAVEVTRISVCPAPGASVNCMPPTDNPLCGADQAWAEKTCNVSFLF